METADTAFFEACLGLTYFLATIAVSMLGLMQESVQTKSAEHVLSFRSPRLLSVGMGMWGLLCLAMALVFSSNAFNAEASVRWFFCAMSLLLAVSCAFLTGVQDVSIDLDVKTCQVTRRWMFRQRTRNYCLSAASSVCACPGRESYYVFLVVGDSTYKRFLLERFSVKADAAIFAREVADKLQVAARELPLSRLGSLN